MSGKPRELYLDNAIGLGQDQAELGVDDRDRLGRGQVDPSPGFSTLIRYIRPLLRQTAGIQAGIIFPIRSQSARITASATVVPKGSAPYTAAVPYSETYRAIAKVSAKAVRPVRSG